jgi:segregation and condensation protein B
MVNQLKSIIEALLFSAEKPLKVKEIHGWLPNEKPTEIKSAFQELLADYEAMKRSFTLKEVAEGFQFRTNAEYAPYILKMFKTTPSRLSRAAMETLSIIAYKQPVLRQEIERLRGVDVGGILRTLMEKDLIKIFGRKNIPGRPLIYGTTKKFLEVFDLKDLDSLPKLKEIQTVGTDDATGATTHEEAAGDDAQGQDGSAGGSQESPAPDGKEGEA